LKIINMSISAGWLVLAVLLLRQMLKKAPKWINVLLWGFVAVRLICPFSIKSALSLIPSAETISPDIMMDSAPQIQTGVGVLNNVVNPIITQTFAPDPGTSMNPLQFWVPLAAVAWIVGIATMLIYTAVSYTRLRRKVATAVLLRDNIYQSENVDSPFVLGVIKPKIYLPFQMESQNLEHVIAHEQAHIHRKDHWWKPIGFVLLALHWFNPFVWLGYILLCRDIELACDEKVIGEMDSETKADYSQALVACSVNRVSIAACPLAFGEVGIKARVKSVLHYKKPTLWIMIAAIVVCIAVAVCFLTNPPKQESILERIIYQNGYDVVKQETKQITLRLSTKDLPQSIYSTAGCEFADGEIVAYGNGKTKIYLKKAMYSNEGTDNLYFIFEFAYALPEHGGRLLNYVEPIEGNLVSVSFKQIDKVIRTPNGNFDNAVKIRGGGGINEIAYYVSTDVLKQIDGEFSFDVKLNEITYLREGIYQEGEFGPLMALYPECFGLDTSKGLDVYVWQMSSNSYSFGLLPHSEPPRDMLDPELMELRGVDPDRMRAILSSYYQIESDIVYVIPWQHPFSSYIPEPWIIEEGDDPEVKVKEYIRKIRNMLFPSELDG